MYIIVLRPDPRQCIRESQRKKQKQFRGASGPFVVQSSPINPNEHNANYNHFIAKYKKDFSLEIIEMTVDEWVKFPHVYDAGLQGRVVQGICKKWIGCKEKGVKVGGWVLWDSFMCIVWSK